MARGEVAKVHVFLEGVPLRCDRPNIWLILGFWTLIQEIVLSITYHSAKNFILTSADNSSAILEGNRRINAVIFENRVHYTATQYLVFTDW